MCIYLLNLLIVFVCDVISQAEKPNTNKQTAAYYRGVRNTLVIKSIPPLVFVYWDRDAIAIKWSCQAIAVTCLNYAYKVVLQCFIL